MIGEIEILLDKKAAILRNKFPESRSVFLPENLLREARRQKNIPPGEVPKICILDPDGDLATYLSNQGRATKSPHWACYHSQLFLFDLDGVEMGILPCIVGSPYAVLVAEQLFVSGCQLLISVTSAGIIQVNEDARQFALITEAVRDEGTSYHYLPQDQKCTLPEHLATKLSMINDPLWFDALSWTTDAPFRETEEAIENMSAHGVTCVEMEAAALYAFALAKEKDIICFAHLTNTMAQEEGDFEKGEFFGSRETLRLIGQVGGIYAKS